jgi:hypothetical protein
LCTDAFQYQNPAIGGGATVHDGLFPAICQSIISQPKFTMPGL